MTNHHTARAVAAETAIAVQEEPSVSRLIFFAAGLGALISSLLLFMGADDPARITMTVFVAVPLVPVFCAVLVWVPLSFTKRTEARRQSVTAAALMAALGVIFFFVEWSARFDLSIFFAIMLFAWGSRLKHRPLKFAALAYVVIAVALRVFTVPGAAFIVLALGVATIVWPLVATPLAKKSLAEKSQAKKAERPTS